MVKIDQSIDLKKIITLIQENKQNAFWYVDRRSCFLQFTITIHQQTKKNHYRLFVLNITCFHMLKNKEKFSNVKQVASEFFDKYHNKGHFFLTQNDAVKYMNNRVYTERSDIVKSAEGFITDNPQFLV